MVWINVSIVVKAKANIKTSENVILSLGGKLPLIVGIKAT